MDRTTGRAEPSLAEADVEFDVRDAVLFREIAATGSVAQAAETLGRSRARVLFRIDALEEAFGPLVDRTRGGTSGGGSQLTDAAIRLLERYDRLKAALRATAEVPETVLEGEIARVSGELATVDTRLGEVRGLHAGLAPGESAQVRIGADAITVLDPSADPAPDATSARNRLAGSVTTIEPGETVFTVHVDVRGTAFPVLVTGESVSRLQLEEGSEVRLTWKATATRLVEVSR